MKGETVRLAGLLAAGLMVVLAAFMVGRALNPNQSAPQVLDISAPAYIALDSAEIVSRAGFEGLELDPGSFPVFRGKVVRADQASLVTEGLDGQLVTLRLTQNPTFQRLQRADRASLQPGSAVAIRLDDEGEAEAILVASPD